MFFLTARRFVDRRRDFLWELLEDYRCSTTMGWDCKSLRINFQQLFDRRKLDENTERRGIYKNISLFRPTLKVQHKSYAALCR